MMLLHNINNNILISNSSYSIVYQDESEKLELYEYINRFWVGTKQKNYYKYDARYSFNNQNMKNRNIFERGWVSWAYWF